MGDSEHSIISARASVMFYDEVSKKWMPSGSSTGLSKVHIYKHAVNNTYRVVGRKIHDHELVINCCILKGMKYNRATLTFHQWRDGRHVYGLHFSSKEDATNFSDAMLKVVELLNDPPKALNSQMGPPPDYSEICSVPQGFYQNENEISTVNSNNSPSTGMSPSSTPGYYGSTCAYGYGSNGGSGFTGCNTNNINFTNTNNVSSNYGNNGGSNVFGTNTANTAPYASNSSGQNTYTTNIVSQSGYGTTSGSQPTYATNSVTQPTYVSNTANQATYATSTGSQPTYATSTGSQPTYATNIANQQTYGTSGVNSGGNNQAGYRSGNYQQHRATAPNQPFIPPPPPPPHPLTSTGPQKMNQMITPIPNLASALANAKLKKTPTREDKEEKNIGSMASMMDEMAKTLARRRAQAEGSHSSTNSKTSSNSQETSGQEEGEKKWEKQVNGNSPNKDTEGVTIQRLRTGSLDSGTINGLDKIDQLKHEILNDLKKELHKIKLEIIEAIKSEISKK